MPTRAGFNQFYTTWPWYHGHWRCKHVWRIINQTLTRHGFLAFFTARTCLNHDIQAIESGILNQKQDPTHTKPAFQNSSPHSEGNHTVIQSMLKDRISICQPQFKEDMFPTFEGDRMSIMRVSDRQCPHHLQELIPPCLCNLPQLPASNPVQNCAINNGVVEDMRGGLVWPGACIGLRWQSHRA